MRSRFRELTGALVISAASVAGAFAARAAATTTVPVLRVCADPNNLPFSDRRRSGFEDRIVDLVAADLGARVETTWWAERRGFIRNTLKARHCDLVAGLPSGSDLALMTAPYYRSSYVFVERGDAPGHVRSLDDPALHRLRIGVQIIGNDYSNYTVYGDYRQQAPAQAIVGAVAKGEVDVAIVWGPLAGYFAPRQPVALVMRPVEPQIDVPFLPMAYDISMGVRRGDKRLRDRVDSALGRHRRQVDAILATYGVPRVDRPGART